MALLLTMVLSLACLSGLTAPGPVPPSPAFKELIEELVNITQDQKVSMGWPGKALRGQVGTYQEEVMSRLGLDLYARG